MVTLGRLRELYENDLLKIEYDKKDNKNAILAGRQLSYEQANNLCKQLGWLEYRLSAFEIIEKTNKFMKSLNSNTKGKEVWHDDITFEFKNLPAVEYNKTIDRIVIHMHWNSYVIIYGDKRAGATYTVYLNQLSVPFAKCRSIKQVVEAITNKEKR